MKANKAFRKDKMIPGLETKESFLNNVKYHKILLVVLVLTVFGNTLFNVYSLDDALDIFENEKVMKGIAGIPEIFTSSFCIINNAEFDYRPISPATFAIEYQLFGLSPHISHFFNILLYIGVALLAYNFLSLLLNKYKPIVVFMIAVLFTVHPLHTEVVASLKNRQELLAYLFGFLSMIKVYEYILKEQRSKYVVLAVFFMILSLLSKLSALPFVGIIVFMLYYYSNCKIEFKKLAIGLLIVAVPLVIIFFTKDWLFRDNYTFDENPLFFATLSERIGTTFKIYLHYFRLLVIPYPLCFYYGFDTIKVIPFYHPISIAGILFFIFLIKKAFQWLKERNVKGVLLLFFLMSVSMYNNVTFIYPGMMSDRAMFMSGTWCIALVVIIVYDEFFTVKSRQRSSVFRYSILVMFCSIFLYYVTWSFIRNMQWKNQLSIMEADIPHLKNSSFANFLYGWSLQNSYNETLDISEKEKAVFYLHQAMKVNMNMAEPNYRLGLIKKYNENDIDSADFYFRKYILLQGNFINGYREFALTAFSKRFYEDALPFFEKVYKNSPTDTINLFYFVQCQYMVNGADAALGLNQKLMEFASQTQYPYINNATIFKLQNRNFEAIENLDNAVKYGGNTPQILNDLAELKRKYK